MLNKGSALVAAIGSLHHCRLDAGAGGAHHMSARAEELVARVESIYEPGKKSHTVEQILCLRRPDTCPMDSAGDTRMADPGPGPRAAHHRPPRTAQSSDEDIPSSEEKEEEEEGYESLDEEEEVDWQERCEELEGVIETLTKRLALNEGGAAPAECASHDSPDASQTSSRFTSLPTASAVVEVPILPSSATPELAVLSDTPVDPLSHSPTILELEAEIAQIQLEMELIREFNALSPDQIEKFKLATLRHSKFAGQTAELLQGGESFASKFHAGNGLMRMIAEARDNVRRIAGSTVLGVGGPKLFKVSNRAKKVSFNFLDQIT